MPFRKSLLLLLLLAATNLAAQENRLTVDRLFNSDEFQAKSFSVNWMPEGGNYFVQQPAADGKGNDIVLIDPKSEDGEAKILIAAKNLVPEGESEPISIESFQVSPDTNKVLVFNNSKRVWRYNTRGDYWIVDLLSGSVRKLGGKDASESSLMFAKFSPDSKFVAYVRDRNVYVESLASGRISQITKTGNENIINGTSDWVYEEELDLRDGFQWSEDGNQIVYWRFDTSGVGLFTMINNTDELYPRLIKFQYPKVGTTNSAVTIGVYDMNSGETNFLDLPGDPRENYPARIHWIPNSSEFLLQRFDRLQNRNTIYAVDATSQKFRTVFEDSDSTWVEHCDWIQWSADGKQFTFISERDGWKHVYLVNVDSGELKLLTPGDFDVIELYHVSQSEQACYFQASPDDAKSRYLYRQKFAQPKLERLTPEDQPGWHNYSFAADGSSAVHTWSRFGVPPTTNTISLPDHNEIAAKEDNEALRKTMATLPKIDEEFFQVDIDDGDGGKLKIDAYVMKPLGFDASTKYPALVYVYGEPWGTTVTDQWERRGRYLWHRMLCEMGYAVFSFDNRGAKCPRGTAFRKAIYKKIGIINASDQAAAMRATLKKFDWIDEDRIGIWGWSGGGSSTLNALFQYPDLYHTGISIAPVPDQRYYDTIYQERYMQTPQLNPEGFKQGSPITHAENLKGNLLVIHGTGDDNCHYQTMELLINKLIASNKQFQMFAYPNRSHSIREYENTTPHLRQMMTNFLLKNLPLNQK
jgi:dipeptidyl-peptidase-4